MRKIHLKMGALLMKLNTMESRKRWFVHVQRRVINVPITNIKLIQVEGTKKKNVEKDTIILVEVTKSDN